MNLRRRIGLLVFQTSRVLMGYSRRIESKRRSICSLAPTEAALDVRQPKAAVLPRVVEVADHLTDGLFGHVHKVCGIGLDEQISLARWPPPCGGFDAGPTRDKFVVGAGVFGFAKTFA